MLEEIVDVLGAMEGRNREVRKLQPIIIRVCLLQIFTTLLDTDCC